MSTSIEERIHGYASVLDRAAEEEQAGPIAQADLHPAHGRRPALVVSLIAVVAASVVAVGVVVTRPEHSTVTSAPASSDVAPDPSTIPPPGTASTESPGAEAWTDIAPSPMTGREDSAAVWTGSEFLVWGGRVADLLYQQGAAYDPTTDTWREITPNQWAGLGTATVWTGARMVVLFKNGGVAYDLANDSWSEAEVPVNDFDQSFEDASWTGTQVLAIGGRTNDGGATSFVATATLVPGTGPWHAGDMSAIPWSSDLQFAATPGGYAVWRPTPDGRGGQAWEFDLATDTWTVLPAFTLDGDRRIESSLPVSTTTGWTVVVTVDSGSAGDPTASSMTATLDGPTWRTTELPSITPTQGASIGNGQIVVFGMSGGVATAMEIDPEIGSRASWMLQPQATSGQALSWNGSELFVWGGRLNAGDVTARGRVLVP